MHILNSKWLGFLGFIGFWYFPDFGAVFDGSHSPWSLTSLLWLLWFANWIPDDLGEAACDD